MTSDTDSSNSLSNETSPYLLQHADNPVHWHAWNEEALKLAQQTDRPILLSIGYSACHWCHVMAHESFEDPTTAEVMNTLFVNIKVDKEERPDLDKIYQNAHSLLTERAGGWPLTVFLTPDTRMPIFAGTYFPKEARHGLPAFIGLLQHISDIWKTRKDDVQQQSNALLSTYQQIYDASKPKTDEFTRAVIDIGRNQIEKQFDIKNGGFSPAPKFPHPAIIDFAIKHWHYTKQLNRPDPRLLHCAIYTLEKMADGGIFDHLGGGFCRYSTDEKWMIPHFEKMLYDNGSLIALYSQAWKIDQQPLFRDAACETAEWVMREMQSPDGGYYSAQDADSENEEGKFFVWQQDEINSLLEQLTDEDEISAETVALFKKRFGLERAENFEGKWHLHGYISENQLCKQLNTDQEELNQQFKQIRQHLFTHREKRIHPDTDTKILCAWNGLMIHGMAIAGRIFDNADYIASASRAAHFIKNTCWKDEQLFVGTKDGVTALPAYLDDYAFLINALLELLQSKWDDGLYQWTLELAEKLLSDFEDGEYGGFYFTSHSHEDLIQRLKSFSDDAIPSGNAIACSALNKLGYLSGRQHYIDSAQRCLRSGWSSMNNAPISHCAMLTSLSEYLTPPALLIIRSQQEDAADWIKLERAYYLPATMIFTIPEGSPLHDTLSEKKAGKSSLAYPCDGLQCQNPINNTVDFEQYLRNNTYRAME